ncbi:MAG: DUF222 domain-containing protein [Microthrixaceae bacterium]
MTETVAGLRAKGWKANRCHLPHGVVARELKAASCLRRFTILADALATGRVSIEHVTAVANATNHRVEAALLQVQDRIVEFAETRRFSHFRTWLASLVELLDQDGAEPDPGEANTASMAADGQGNLHLVLELTGVDAVCAQRIINNETDRQTRQAQRETETTGAPMPTAQQLRARAVVELLRRGAKANPNSPKPAVEAVVTVTVDPNGRPTAHSIDTDGPLDATTAATLLCDATLQPLAVNPAGDPLNLGRRQRFFTPQQHQALTMRDGGCVFPGCDQPPARCDAHHLHHWQSGGRTDINNAALLCRRHHHLHHSNAPWELHQTTIDQLPPELAEQHRQRAHTARLHPSNTVATWTDPHGQTHLAQTATNHHPPTPQPQDLQPQQPGDPPHRDKPAA